MKLLFVDRNLCTGCRTCESTCSFTKEKVVNRGKSRIRVDRLDVLKMEALVCLQCAQPRCRAACPTGAIYREGEQVRVRQELCDGCGSCMQVCNRLFLAPDHSRVLMCDQCGACVVRCPEGALRIATPEEIRAARKAQPVGGQA